MKQRQGNEAEKVSTEDYYREYHGHLVHHLQKILPVLRASSDRLIWTAGDSSLDNKYWVKQTSLAIGGYEQVLDPPTMKKDVTYWLTSHCENSPAESTRHRTRTINTAVEATTLNQRTSGLLAQDVFLRDHIQSQDMLVVSIGGNDIAMRPAPCTICALAGVLCLPQFCVDHAVSCGTCPCDDPCSGCGPSICTCACACPPCLGYFRHMFGTRIEHYVKALTKKTKPAKILVCMIYYPDEASNVRGWASSALRALGYDRNPARVQGLIRKAFHEALATIEIPGCQVVPVPLFQVLDGKNTKDYVARVEPSCQGGSKMAEFLLDVIDNAPAIPQLQPPLAPTTALIQERG